MNRILFLALLSLSGAVNASGLFSVGLVVNTEERSYTTRKLPHCLPTLVDEPSKRLRWLCMNAASVTEWAPVFPSHLDLVSQSDAFRGWTVEIEAGEASHSFVGCTLGAVPDRPDFSSIFSAHCEREILHKDGFE